MIKEVYQAFKKRLGEEITALNWIDWYLAQYDMEGQQALWTTPAAFVEFLPINWQMLTNGVQASNIMLQVHLVNESHYDDDKRMTDDQVDHLGMENEVYLALQNWRCMLSYLDEYAALAGTPDDRVLVETVVRSRTYPDHLMSRVLVSVQEFTTRIYDYSATPQWGSVLASLDLQVEKATIIQPPYTK